MSTDLVPIVPEVVEQLPALPRVEPTDLYGALLADATKDTTRRARIQDINALAKFLGRYLGPLTPAKACESFVLTSSGQANALGTAYRADMLSRKLASSTVNRRLCTLRRLVKLARKFGLIDWMLELDGLEVVAFRDTTGVGRTGWVKMLELVTRDARRTSAGKRNLAILLLLHDHGLRRTEVTALDLADWDPNAGRLQILGKRRREKESITINAPTIVAISAWVAARGPEPGPLFIRLDRARPADVLSRIDGDSVLNLVAELGRRAKLGKRARPHGLRHQAVTRLLELTNGNIVAAQSFARHSDIKTTKKYDDNRKDTAGEMARLLGDNL